MGIVAPSKADIFTEEISYRSAVSEELLRKLAAAVNAINHGSLLPLGSTEMSFLPLAKFQIVRDNSWVLLDGANITTTDLGQFMLAQGLATGTVYLPDMRGQVPIGVNNGRSDGKQNLVSASLALGGQMGDGNKSHQHYVAKAATQTDSLTSSHSLATVYNTGSQSNYTLAGVPAVADVGLSSSSGQNQTTVNSVGVNWFIKVWNTAR
jgi:hypothetical protein